MTLMLSKHLRGSLLAVEPRWKPMRHEALLAWVVANNEIDILHSYPHPMLASIEGGTRREGPLDLGKLSGTIDEVGDEGAS